MPSFQGCFGGYRKWFRGVQGEGRPPVRRVFCHEVRVDSIRPRRRLAARGLVGEPDVSRPEIVARRAASRATRESCRLRARLAECDGEQARAKHHKAGHGYGQESIRHEVMIAHGNTCRSGILITVSTIACLLEQNDCLAAQSKGFQTNPKNGI